MAQHRAPRKHTGTWIVIAILLAAAVIGTLWVPIVAILAAAAYLLSRLGQRGSGAKDQSPDYDRREAN